MLSEVGALNPRGTSWDPGLSRGIGAQSSSCASLFLVGPGGSADLPLTLGEGDRRWRVDEELRSGECSGGRAD